MSRNEYTNLPTGIREAEQKEIAENAESVASVNLDGTGPFPVDVYAGADASRIENGLLYFDYAGVRRSIREEVGDKDFLQMMQDLIVGAKKHDINVEDDHKWIVQLSAEILRGDFDESEGV